MAKTVEELNKQIADLENEKKKLIEISRNETIASIKQLITEYSLTASDLGLKATKKTVKSKAVYANPDFPEQTWTGKGRKPDWVNSYLALGKSLENALIK